MLKVNDVVQDNNGILGIVVDGNEFKGDYIVEDDDNFGVGVIFMDVDADSGVWWSTSNKEQIENSCIVEKVEKDTSDYNRLMSWYAEYNDLYKPWVEATIASISHDKEKEAYALRPTQNQLEELYKKYQIE